MQQQRDGHRGRALRHDGDHLGGFSKQSRQRQRDAAAGDGVENAQPARRQQQHRGGPGGPSGAKHRG